MNNRLLKTKKAQAKPKAKKAATKNPADLQTKIQNKAYELYQQRGGNHGNDWNDWFEAERLVRTGK